MSISEITTVVINRLINKMLQKGIGFLFSSITFPENVDCPIRIYGIITNINTILLFTIIYGLVMQI